MEYGYTISAWPAADPVTCAGGIFTECSNGPQQPAFEYLVKVLKPGDSLVIPSLSVFGSSLAKVCEKWNEVENKGATIQILDFPDGISQLSTASLGRVFNYANETIQTRLKLNQQAGYERAKKNGKHRGRKPLEIPRSFGLLQKQYKAGTITARQAALQLNVSVPTFLRWLKNDESKATGKREGANNDMEEGRTAACGAGSVHCVPAACSGAGTAFFTNGFSYGDTASDRDGSAAGSKS